MTLFTFAPEIVRYLSGAAVAEKVSAKGSVRLCSEHTTIPTRRFTTLCAADRTSLLPLKMVQAQADRSADSLPCLI